MFNFSYQADISRERTDDIPPTVGFNIKTVQVDRFKVNVWDVGGQKSIRSFWRNYFDTTDGLIWVIDSSDADRLRDCRAELHGLLKEDRLAGASLLVMANKQDIPGALGIVEIEEFLGISEIKRTRHCAIVPCSAFSKDSITDGFHWIIHDIGERIYTLR